MSKRVLSETLYNWLIAFGLNPSQTIRACRAFPSFLHEKNLFKKLAKQAEQQFKLTNMSPCLSDRYENGGVTKGAYFNQDLLVAKRIFLAKPRRHIDIGSRVDGLIAHLAVFMPVEVVDIRPLSAFDNMTFRQIDLMNPLPSEYINQFDSISSLHAIEHFGLGRYGDPIDTRGWEKGLNNIHQMLKPNGIFYFSVPIGPMRVEFNAQRVFDVEFLKSFFEKDYTIRRFSYVDDAGDLHDNISIEDKSAATNFGCWYGCGIFELQKKLRLRA